MLNLTVTDKRTANLPPLDTAAMKFKDVLLTAAPTCETSDLTIEIFLEENPGRTKPTSYAHPVVEDGKANQDHWHLHLFLVPKEELSFGTLRAISRATSREIFTITAMQAYGEMLAAMYSPQSFADAQTKFADDAPWVLS